MALVDEKGSKRDMILSLMESEDSNLRLVLSQGINSPYYKDLLNSGSCKSTRDNIFATYVNEATFRDVRSKFYAECKKKGLVDEELKKEMDGWDEKNDGLPEYLAPGMRQLFAKQEDDFAEITVELRKKENNVPKTAAQEVRTDGYVPATVEDGSGDEVSDESDEYTSDGSIEEDIIRHVPRVDLSTENVLQEDEHFQKGYQSKVEGLEVLALNEDRVVRMLRDLMAMNVPFPKSISSFFDMKEFIQTLPEYPKYRTKFLSDFKGYLTRVCQFFPI